MKHFKQCTVWQKGFAIAVSAFRFTSTLLKEVKFSVASLLTRAAISISSNIAEGVMRKIRPVLLKSHWAPFLNWKLNC